MPSQSFDSLSIGTPAVPANARLAVVGGAITVGSSPYKADAALHISASFGGADRLLQMSPTGSSKHGLNILASTDAAGTAQWWAWGVCLDGSWRIQPGTEFSNREFSGGLIINSSGRVGIGLPAIGIPADALLAVGGAIQVGAIKANNSDLYFTKTDHVYTGAGNEWGNAAIENSSDYNSLMILGRTVSTDPFKRVVSLWDEVQVNGPLKVHNSDLYFTKTDHVYTGAGNEWGNAAIENSSDYNSLMILGRTVSTDPFKRVVSLWDEVQVNGPLKVHNSDLYFTKTDHVYTGAGNEWGNAAIENSSDYNSLMILGRTVSTDPFKRVVSLWDEVQVNGPLKVHNSDLYFTKTDHVYTGAGNEWGNAAIENSSDYNSLMILGRTVSTDPFKRVVSLWDEVQVNGPLKVHNSDLYFTKTDHVYTGAGNEWGNAAIENSSDYNSLMILGRTVSTDPFKRVVSLWDEVTVSGDLLVSGDVQLQNEDCAEDFEVVATVGVEPGTVMVLNDDGQLEKGIRPYDKRVTGVVSGAGGLRPGLVLGRQPRQTDRLPIALMGKVYCKVDAQYAPIEVGDLLTTSPTPGHAMNATDSTKAFGAIIGKALKPLDAGTGLIPILVALQ